MQTGVMRETAQLRSIQDLNHRLVTFFADYGLPCIGINGFQRGTLTISDENHISINTDFIKGLPNKTHLILSGLVQHETTEQILTIPIAEFVQQVTDQLEIDIIYVFTTDEKAHFMTNSDADLKKIAFLSQNDEKINSVGYPVDLVGLHRPHYLCKPIYNNNIKKFDAMYYLGFIE
jgi:hypothetical protein